MFTRLVFLKPGSEPIFFWKGCFTFMAAAGSLPANKARLPNGAVLVQFSCGSRKMSAFHDISCTSSRSGLRCPDQRPPSPPHIPFCLAAWPGTQGRQPQQNPGAFRTPGWDLDVGKVDSGREGHQPKSQSFRQIAHPVPVPPVF